MKRSIAQAVIKILIFTLLMFTAYYFFFLQSGVTHQQAQRIIGKHQARLLQNRLALTQLAKLNADAPGFQKDKEHLLTILKQTNEDGIKALQNERKFSETSSQLFQKSQSIFTRQKQLFAPLFILDEKLQKIFLYDPQEDLGALRLPKDKQILFSRAENARKGLHDIERHIEKLSLETNEIQLLQIKNKETREALGALIESIEQADTKTIQHKQTEAVKLLSQLKQLAWNAELSLIQSDASIKLLTEQTNLLYEYNFYLQKVL